MNQLSMIKGIAMKSEAFSQLPFSQACENNKRPILEVLSQWLKADQTIWEVGSGTGQHAQYFAQELPDIHWQPTDLAANLSHLEQRFSLLKQKNILNPLPLDVSSSHWPTESIGHLFTANTLHIMSKAVVERFILGLHQRLEPQGFVYTYGPFKYQGAFTSDSNEQFDLYLKQRNAESGIKDFEWIEGLFEQGGTTLIKDYVMPANNQLLIWQRQAA